MNTQVDLRIEAVLSESHLKKEIGDYAVWTLSSAKPRFDVAMLRDNNLETHWQSDGPAPHTINIQFHKKTTVNEISVYLDHSLDETYTPCQLLIRAGSTLLDLQDIKVWEFEKAQGWLTFILPVVLGRTVRANFFQVVIQANTLGGRDSRVRQIKVFGPLEGENQQSNIPNFDDSQMFMFNTIR